MPRILIVATRPSLLAPSGTQPMHVEVITPSEADGIYGLHCTHDQIDECPGGLEPGDTWTHFEDCIQEAVKHVALHERRVCETCAGRMRFEYGHTGPNGEIAETATCTSCGSTEVRQ